MTMVLSDSASTVFSQVAFIANPPSWLVPLIRHATKLRKHIWIMGLVPVAEAGSQQLFCRRPRGAFEHEMFSIKKIFRVVGISLYVGSESRKRSKGRVS